MSTHSKHWRQSASLITVAKTTSSGSNFNYNLLTITRSKSAPVLPNATVFPGGVLEKADTSRDWLQLYEKFGIKPEFLDILNHKSNQPSIFVSNESNEIPKYISLRITAIRETFEECGILICKTRKNVSNESSSWADFVSSEEIQMWRKKIYQDPSQFIELCSQLEIFPDLWSLYEWSNWVTPASVATKFDVVFFIVNFRKTPLTYLDEQEIASIQWKTPQEYLDMQRDKKYFMVVPQFYEISRLSIFSDIDKLLKFSSDRAKLGLEAFLPHVIQTDNGIYVILPGDDLYPHNINEAKEDVTVINEIPNSNVQHRVRISAIQEMNLISKNYLPKYNHIAPLRSKM